MSAHRTHRDFAHELADLADELTLSAFRRRTGGGAVDTKDDGSWVTDTDRSVEQALRAAIRDRFPEHAVLGEEGGLDGPGEAPRWILDPIDGTTNFVKGNPIFATLIALQIDGREVVGVVSAPALGSRWDGIAGGPARQDGRRIRVSDVDELDRAEVAFGGLNYFQGRGMLELISTLARRTDRQRGYGDFWQHCLVASGSTDAALEAEVSLWDLAAVRCVVEAAGGRFTDLSGRATAEGGSAISSNGLLHSALLDLAGTLAAEG